MQFKRATVHNSEEDVATGTEGSHVCQLVQGIIASIPRKQSEQEMRPRYNQGPPSNSLFLVRLHLLKVPQPSQTAPPPGHSQESVGSVYIQALHGFLPSSTRTVRWIGNVAEENRANIEH